MVDKTKLLDPTSTEKLSEREKKIVSDAQNTGRSLRSSDPVEGDEYLRDVHNTDGIVEQTVDSKAVAAFGRPGGDESDITGDVANPPDERRRE